MTMANAYHYTEGGLDNVYLLGGVVYVDAPQGRQIVIEDIDGLHRVIGNYLVDRKRDLSGKELRFLRHEMLMSQATLARLLNVTEQTVHRWEAGKTGQVPKPAEALVRLLYKEHSGGNEKVKSVLKQIADLEDEIDDRLTLEQTRDGWRDAA